MNYKLSILKSQYYRCEYCGSLFDEPHVRRFRECLDGEHGWQTFYDASCPVCGCEDFEELGDDAETDLF